MIHTFETLAKSDNKTLEEVMKDGTMPNLESMIGWEFDGYNLTFMATILGIRKFRKGFYKIAVRKSCAQCSCATESYKGYNVKMEQNKFEQPWKYKNGKPERFGWFDIISRYGALALVEDTYLNAVLLHHELGRRTVLLHYGLDKRNNLFTGKMLRDFLVQVNDRDKDLCLGKAYNAVGKNLVMPSYFIIKRAEKINF